jgi:nicotinamidase/pyrazinamidase
LQNDFCPGGNLAIPEGDTLMPIANHLQAHFDLVIATKDWHPKDHTSFASNHAGKAAGEVVTVNEMQQILWADHCVQGTHGAEFHPAFETHNIKNIFYKGVDKFIDSYSAFFDNAHLRSTGLGDFLNSEKVHDIYLMGLATDYCIKYSSLDAIKLGFNVHVIVDACRGVELQAGDIQRALAEMEEASVRLLHIRDLTQL